MSLSQPLLAVRGGVSSTCSSFSSSPDRASRPCSQKGVKPPAKDSLLVPSSDVILLIPSTAPQLVGDALNLSCGHDSQLSFEPTRQSYRLRSKPTLRCDDNGVNLPTPEATPPLTDSCLSPRSSVEADPGSIRAASPTRPVWTTKDRSKQTERAMIKYAACLSSMPTMLDFLQYENAIGSSTIFSAPLAYSHAGSHTTSFNSLRAHLLSTRSTKQLTLRLHEELSQRQLGTENYLETKTPLGTNNCSVPFTQARNTTSIRFAPAIVPTMQVHEHQDQKSIAGLFSPGLYISPAETAYLEDLVRGPGSERFVFGGTGACSGDIHGDNMLVGVWYRVLDGALKVTVVGDNLEREEVILVDGDVSTAVVMLGRTHQVSAVNLAGQPGALATGAVLFATGLVPMTRFYSRQRLGEVLEAMR